MNESIKQNGKTLLSSNDGQSIRLIWNNLTGANFNTYDYKNYLQRVAYAGGFVKGIIEYWQEDKLIKTFELK